VLIRRERASDETVIRALHRAAFSRPARDGAAGVPGTVEAQLVDELRREGDLVPQCCLVAEAEEPQEARVVGHVAMSRATVDGAPGVLALGPLGVDPDHQRRGVGSALMHAAIAAADALDAPAIVLLGHPDYYPRFGFEAAVNHGITPPGPWGPEFFMVRLLSAWDGSQRGAFRYAPAFERLDA
jgi:putative acetyltransferase